MDSSEMDSLFNGNLIGEFGIKDSVKQNIEFFSFLFGKCNSTVNSSIKKKWLFDNSNSHYQW